MRLLVGYFFLICNAASLSRRGEKGAARDDTAIIRDGDVVQLRRCSGLLQGGLGGNDYEEVNGWEKPGEKRITLVRRDDAKREGVYAELRLAPWVSTESSGVGTHSYFS